MDRRVVILAVEKISSMGRGVIRGAAAYARGRTDWRFVAVTAADRQFLGLDVSPSAADGLIGMVHPDIAEQWRGDQRRYAVNISRGQNPTGAASVTCDDGAIGRMAADYLKGKGLEHFAYFGPANSGQRVRGFVHRLRDGPSPSRIADELSDEALTGVLAALPRPCGILAFNDIEAVRLIRCAGEAGLDVPGDLAIVGVDDDLLASVFSPVPLTSVEVDFEKVGYEAARVLDGIFRGADPPAQAIRIPPTRIIERQSTDFPGQIDGLAVQAARVIGQLACEPIRVPDMLADLPASYRTIDRRFRRAFGRSLQEQITRVRMKRAAELLSTTHLPLSAIAERLGYANVNYFTTVFRNQMGTAPGRYRKAHAPAEGG